MYMIQEKVLITTFRLPSTRNFTGRGEGGVKQDQILDQI